MKAIFNLAPSHILTITITGLEWDSAIDTSLIGRTLELAYGYHLHGQLEYDEATNKYKISFHRWGSDENVLEAAKNALKQMGIEVEDGH